MLLFRMELLYVILYLYSIESLKEYMSYNNL
jgi:hypothetical protein